MLSVRFDARSSQPQTQESSSVSKNVQWFVDRLVERMVPTIGSFITSALQRMLILNHAEHHDQLEDQAQRYEAAGKKDIAKLIRAQAQSLTLDKPLPLADQVLSEFGAENPALFEATQATGPMALPDSTRRNKSRRRPPEVNLESEEGQS